MVIWYISKDYYRLLISGVVMYELLEGAVPYYEIADAKSVVDHVCSGNVLEKPTHIETPDNIYNLMLECFTMDPEDRPDFKTIFTTLKQILSEIPDQKQEDLMTKEIEFLNLSDIYLRSPQSDYLTSPERVSP
jgi:serine/threonine protein kinase